VPPACHLVARALAALDNFTVVIVSASAQPGLPAPHRNAERSSVIEIEWTLSSGAPTMYGTRAAIISSVKVPRNSATSSCFARSPGPR
jgi:hypothetical protein